MRFETFLKFSVKTHVNIRIISIIKFVQRLLKIQTYYSCNHYFQEHLNLVLKISQEITYLLHKKSCKNISNFNCIECSNFVLKNKS